jgi:exonuclease III
MAHIKIQSLNTRGLADPLKRRDFFKRFREQNVHICCLQDIHVDTKFVNRVKAEWGLSAVICPLSSHARGVAVLFNNFDYELHRSRIDPGGNYIILDITISNSTKFTLVNLYGPNEDNPDFYTNIFNIIEEFGNDNYILCGDWNLVLDSDKDLFNYKAVNNPKARNKVLSYIAEKELVDIWRSFHENDRHFTWSKRNPIKMARLDFFLATENMLSIFSDAYILPKYKSDHAPVNVHVIINTSLEEHGKGYWKFNNSLLKDLEFVKLIKNEIINIKTMYAASPYNPDFISVCPCKNLLFSISDQLFWETLLVQLRGRIISYASRKKRKTNELEKSLEQQILELDEQMKSNPNTVRANLDTLEQLNLELEDIRNNTIQGTMIRSRARWHELGEKPSSYFLNLENRNHINKTIVELKKEDGTVITGKNEILKTQKLFYEKLYSCQNEEVDDATFFEKLNPEDIPTLSEDDRNSIEGQITYNELLEALKRSKNDKSPGLDGYTSEFFKFFWIDIGHFLLRSINFAYKNNTLSITQKQGVITCLPKPGKPRNSLKNWRPISLLNFSYKLMSSCVAERIKLVLDNIIHDDQKGFIPGRFIGENIRLLYDIIFETQKQNKPGMLLLIDFEKAFDTVSWCFIKKTLDVFNFGDSIKKWIQLFQWDTESCIIQNGHFSSFLKLGRGCRQGDPISPYIFVMCAELLGIAIRNNKGINGIKLWDTMFKISQYADDTSLLLDGTKESLRESLITLQWFYKISGLKINMDKTKVIWLGSMRESDRRFCRENNLDWSNSFVALGVEFPVLDITSITDRNILPKIQNMKHLLNTWSYRNLTPLGKVTVIKSLILPKISHLLISLPNPNEQIRKEIDSMFTQFIWNKKPPKIKKAVLEQMYDEGGLKMVKMDNYINSLKLSWIRRLCQKQNTWSIFPEKYNVNNILTMGSKFLKHTVKIDNLFWADVMSAWQNMCECFEADNIMDILNQPLWGNPNIKIEYIKVWHNNKLVCVRDLVKEDGSLKTLEDLRSDFNIPATFLDYHRLIKAVPKTWLNVISTENIPQFPYILPQLQAILKVKKGCSVYSSIFSQCHNILPHSQTKWNKDLTLQDNNVNWKKIYKLPFLITLDTRLRYFQYKLLHRILPTNKFLALIKIKDSDSCSLCGKNVESVLHLFVECEEVSQLWLDLQQWLALCGYIHIDHLQPSDIILGNPDEDISFNFTILIAKFVIYRCKFNNRKPTIAAVKAYLKYVMEIEKYIAVTNNKVDKFYGKWASLLHKLK